MAVDSVSVSKQSVSRKKERLKSPEKKVSKSQESVVPPSPAKRNKSPGIRVVGGRIYDSVNGKTCHQVWRAGRRSSCLRGVELSKCRGICNCSICMKKRGHQPTGMLISMAKATGFSSVSELLLKGAEHLNHENAVADVVASPKKEIVLSPRKRGKENSFDGKVDANLPNPVDKKPKKVKEVHGECVNDNTSLKIVTQSPDKRKLKQEGLEDKHDGNKKLGPKEESIKNRNKKDSVEPLENDERKEDNGNSTANDKIVLEQQYADFHAEVPLPVGTDLNSVAGIDILEVKKGQPECILRDLLHGRTGRRGKFSVTVQFHIHLLSILQTEQGEECATLSPSNGKNSWFHALKKCLTESRSALKAQGLDSLEKAADYETLEASEKLRLLNLLCDEVLGTEKVRNWMDDQNTKLAEMVKEAKQKVLAAKDKEKSLKKKMKDDIAKAIIARHGAPLSISEHEAIVARIKRETAQAHARVLESKGMLLKDNRTSDAVRIEPIFMGRDGHAYWKLSCSGKSEVLHQDAGNGDALTLDEKWFAIDDQGKEQLRSMLVL
ncbi:hypothetical protein Sango_0094900 [Sesamum angolense]|uniref:Zinc-finger domain-containing protein n=1 Tax=Sesamum angolense TaxID=2727404 RepID=A0AAE1XF14_9LAMI|nr:hypothetical protein Sango_0094900 [Sesamum angolense]